LFQKKKLDRAVIGKTSRRLYPSVIQDQQISRPNELRQLEEPSMIDRLSLSIEHHHAGVLPARKRSQGDQFPRERIIVITQRSVHVKAAKAMSLKWKRGKRKSLWKYQRIRPNNCALMNCRGA
jgi:hypothetical protein